MDPVVRTEGLGHRYGRHAVLAPTTLDIPAGCVVGLIGPDGVGKSTLLGLIAGAKRCQAGTLRVLGGDMKSARHRRKVCPRIAFMPQGLGKNLYADLSARENIDFFARLFGHGRRERRRRMDELLAATGLEAFGDRPAGKLSGGMRQKLGLCCALVHDPDLLILDEPTTGVDPLSRRQFWELIARLRARQPAMSVLVATAYLEEAEQFDWLIAMNVGAVLATGTPAQLKSTAGVDTVEAAFVALLPEGKGRGPFTVPPRRAVDHDTVISARDLTRRFGDFTAVDHVSFDIQRGEIFGFVGSNGCGKTTTMKMLTGLLPATEGAATLSGKAIATDGMRSRMRVGYMSQSFSLYTELTVRQNLDLHARLFHLPAATIAPRVEHLMEQFGLADFRDQLASSRPLGIRQRLSLAVAMVHRPDVLILDEPTSGVDPLARDLFWRLLVDLSRNTGVTIFISTHFMNEAARCDRIALMDSGRVLVTGTPQELIAARGARSLDEAFVSYLEAAKGKATLPDPGRPEQGRAVRPWGLFSPRRMIAYALRESLELLRDPIRLAFALGGTAFLMLIFGFGITTDVDSLSFAVLDRDNSFESRAYLEEMRGSTYFVERRPIADSRDLEARLRSGLASVTLEIPPGFGRDLKHGRRVEVAAWIDGAMPFRAETIRGYLAATHGRFLTDLAIHGHGQMAAPPPADVSVRFRYNQDFSSVYAMVPAQLALQLALIPAILMALAIVREKELGSIVNLYVTPVTRLEFLLGKQIPYVALAMANFAIMFLMALFIFGVPLKGSFLALLLGAVVYVLATTAYGQVISAFTRTQIAALFGTAILTVLPATMFAGMLTPVSSLSGLGAFLGRFFPMSYFLPVSLGTFTKGLGLGDLAGHLLVLSAFFPALMLLSLLLVRPQEP